MNVAGAPAPVFDERFELYSPGVCAFIGNKASTEKRTKLLFALLAMILHMVMIKF